MDYYGLHGADLWSGGHGLGPHCCQYIGALVEGLGFGEV